jgi:hypothetical protein
MILNSKTTHHAQEKARQLSALLRKRVWLWRVFAATATPPQGLYPLQSFDEHHLALVLHHNPLALHP